MRELITNAFGKDQNLNPLSKKEQQRIKQFADEHGAYKVSNSIENFLIRLNSTKKFDDIPDTIGFNYTQLLERNLDLTNLTQLINLNLDLLFEKFGRKKNIRISGFVTTSKINAVDHKRLCSAGFLGSTLAPSIHGSEAAKYSVDANRKDPSHWCKESLVESHYTQQIITPSATVLKIPLTFRQEQIVKLIVQRGLTNKQIAKMLNLSDSTVKLHIGIVLKKYGLQSRTQLTALLKENW